MLKFSALKFRPAAPVCALFRQSGYYELEGVDRDGWPHYRQLKALPPMGMAEQENFMKDHILLYFENL